MRYLNKDELVHSLVRGGAIEHLLPSREENGLRIVRFLRLDRERTGVFSVTLFEVIDEGSPQFLDVYEFSALEPDSPYGLTESFVSAQEALLYSRELMKADLERFVNAGLIQDEYHDAYHTKE